MWRGAGGQTRIDVRRAAGRQCRGGRGQSGAAPQCPSSTTEHVRAPADCAPPSSARPPLTRHAHPPTTWTRSPMTMSSRARRPRYVADCVENLEKHRRSSQLARSRLRRRATSSHGWWRSSRARTTLTELATRGLARFPGHSRPPATDDDVSSLPETPNLDDLLTMRN